MNPHEIYVPPTKAISEQGWLARIDQAQTDARQQGYAQGVFRSRALLIESAALFRKYEELHRAKGTPESTAKAEVNAEIASRIEAALLISRRHA